MRNLIYIEDEGHQRRAFLASVMILLLSIPRILVILLTREIHSATATARPRNMLDAMRSSRWPSVRVTRDSCIILSETLYADGFEVAIRRRGFTWTWRVGQVGPFISSRAEYLAHYGAGSLPRHKQGRRAA